MKRFLIALTTILTAHLAVAQTASYRNNYKHYEGKMGKTDVVMEAFYFDNDVSGIVYPKKSSECLHVQGSAENGVLNLSTADNRKITITDLKEDYSQCMRFNEVYAELYDSIPFAPADEDNPVATNTIAYTYLQPAAYKGIETNSDTKALFAKMFNAAPQQSVEGYFFYPEPYPTMKLKNDFQAAKNSFRKFVDNELQTEDKITAQELTMQETNYQYVTYNANGLVCIINHCYSYAGGAHGMYAHIPVIFDLEQNRVLTKEDIFKPGTDAAIIKLIIKYFIAHGDADDKPSDESEGIFKDDVFVENNIGIENGNIIFYYQPYDINSYVAGAYSAVIKISELLPYITDNSPIKRMLK